MLNRQSTILSLCLMAAALPLPARILYFATTGNDNNYPCTYAAPCKSFGALNSANAVNPGDTILALDSVDFNSQQTQSYSFFGSITIDGGVHGAFLTTANCVSCGGGIGISFNSGAYANMVLRNVTIVVPSGSGNTGAYFSLAAGGSISLENVTVLMEGGVDTYGLYLQSAGSQLSAIQLDGVRVSGSGTGINILANNTTQVTADNVSTDVTGTGLSINDGYGAIRNSNFRTTSTSTATGLSLTYSSGPSVFLVDTCSFKDLGFGLVEGLQGFPGSGTVRISKSSFSGNVNGVYVWTGTAISFRNNVFAGNNTDGAPTLTTSLK
jgi:hypothetical protein